MKTIPDGPSLPPTVQTAWWMLRPLAFLDTCRRQFGDAFSVRFVGLEQPLVMLSEPQAIRSLYGWAGHKPRRSNALRPLFGDASLLLLEGSQHLARRKLILPALHREGIRTHEEVVREIVTRNVRSWPQGNAFALHPRMSVVTLEIILKCVFGVSNPVRASRLRKALPLLVRRASSRAFQLAFFLSSRAGRSVPLTTMREPLREIDELLLAEIDERRRRPADSGRGDVLSMLAASRFEDGSAPSDRELRDQLVTLMLVGHHTTATALAWTFDLLLHTPSAYTRLLKELDEGGDEYLRAVVYESLRLRPVLPFVGRRLRAPLRVGSVELAPGTDVAPVIWLMHTRPDLYPDPYAFQPERFLERPPEASTWITFGGGVHRCIGAALAELQMRIVLEVALHHWRLFPADRQAARVIHHNLSFAPYRGTRVRAMASNS